MAVCSQGSCGSSCTFLSCVNLVDVIMDMLGNQRMRQLITDYYQCTDEPKLVTQAVKKAWCRERKFSQEMMGESIDGEEVKPPSKWEQFKYVVCLVLYTNLFVVYVYVLMFILFVRVYL